MIGFCSLASGSKANAAYVGSASTKILIDAGLSMLMLRKRLQQIGVQLEEIDAILISHEHIDHIKGLSRLASAKGLPVLVNSDTARAIFDITGYCPAFKIFATGETFTFGDLEIHPFSIQHDAVDPVAFTIHLHGCKLGFCSDLGAVTPLVESHLQGCDYLYIEANHEPSMVHASPRPLFYKQRVLSQQGHLSNRDCADLLRRVCHPQLKHVCLVHLSQECNSQQLAKKTAAQALSGPAKLSIAQQDRIGEVIRLH